ncbi:acetolactate synthase small subunit [Celerinatantimonas sp. MCCC 1A17872]|uniref:acetolactate synthase small subunit n=1 Tax=Celerinatantimonas sp. MCCC 1A17872 TaxID=3177514 RepID=UPI0038C5EA98
MRRIISILIENEAGSLSRVVGLFSQRGYNIDSLTVAATDDPTLSRMTITTFGDERMIEQITKQLHKLVDVLKVTELTDSAYIEREIALIKVKTQGVMRAEVMRLSEIFRGQIVNVTASEYVLQITGDGPKIDACIRTLAELTEVLEVVRSGTCGISRSDKMLHA